MNITFIPTIGIRHGDNILDFAGRCQDCDTFWIYGGFEDYCADCV